MKTSDESVKKAKAKNNGSGRQTRGSKKNDPLPESYEFPHEHMIAEAAYFLAKKRGFIPQNEIADWLQAEVDVAFLLRRGSR